MLCKIWNQSKKLYKLVIDLNLVHNILIMASKKDWHFFRAQSGQVEGIQWSIFCVSIICVDKVFYSGMWVFLHSSWSAICTLPRTRTKLQRRLSTTSPKMPYGQCVQRIRWPVQNWSAAGACLQILRAVGRALSYLKVENRTSLRSTCQWFLHDVFWCFWFEAGWLLTEVDILG